MIVIFCERGCSLFLLIHYVYLYSLTFQLIRAVRVVFELIISRRRDKKYICIYTVVTTASRIKANVESDGIKAGIKTLNNS